MDRGDNGFILHESFKDLKTRRAEQEAYRRALEEQIMQKRKLQEQDREKYQGRREDEMTAVHTPLRYPPSPAAFQTPRKIQPPEAFSTPISHNMSLSSSQSNATMYEHSTPAFKGGLFSFNETGNYIDPHPEGTARHVEVKSVEHTSSSDIPQFSPECVKYLQQVIPGFKLPQPQSIPKASNDSMSSCQNMTRNADKSVHRNPTPRSNEFSEIQQNLPNEHNSNHDHHPDAAFSSSGTSSESSSTEDVSTHHGKNRVHVSQTSEQMEGVKVSRKQYREELQKQINERKRRDEEQQRKAQEEEAKIQEKIRIEQEKMQREYEEELRKQEEREREAEQKRLASLEKQKEIIKAKEEAKAKSRSSTLKLSARKDIEDNSCVNASRSASEESIQSIGEFFDDTIMSQGTKFVNPDDRIIPVVAKQLREKSFHKEKSEQPGSSTLTARVDSTLMDSSLVAPPPYQSEKGLVRELTIRSAPCPSTINSTDLEFLASLKNYLQGEKSKIDERVHARASKSTEQF